MLQLIAWILATLPGAQADQARIDAFFRDHAVASSRVYCRTDIAAAECRTLIRFTNKASGEPVEAFQIAFFAPSRQGVGTELFLPTERRRKFQQYVDKNFDGKFEGETGDLLSVRAHADSLRISGWRPTPKINASLKFTDTSAVLEGQLLNDDGTKQPVLIRYERFRN